MHERDITVKYLIRNFFVGFFVVGLMTACASTVASVPAGTNWSGLLSGLLVFVIVATLGVYFGNKWWQKNHAAPAPAPAAGTDVPTLRTRLDGSMILSPDAQAIANSIGELLGHLKDQAAATAAKDAPPGGDGVPGVVIVKVGGTASTDIPALIAAYFAAGAKAKAKRAA